MGTIQPYHTANGTLKSWQWCVMHRNLHCYKYNIFAYREITVNHVPGHHRHQNQYEIAFPRGIQPEMIYMHEYKGTWIIWVYQNSRFNITVNPWAPPLEILPILSFHIPIPLCYPHVPVTPHRVCLFKMMTMTTSHRDGEEIADPYDTHPSPPSGKPIICIFVLFMLFHTFHEKYCIQKYSSSQKYMCVILQT